MDLIRTVITRFRRPSPELEALTPRLLDDAGIVRRENKGLMGAMLASFTPNHAVEMIRER